MPSALLPATLCEADEARRSVNVVSLPVDLWLGLVRWASICMCGGGGAALNMLNGGIGNSETEGVGTMDAAELLAVRNERGSSDLSEFERSK